MKKFSLIISVIIIIVVVWMLYPTEKRKMKSDIMQLKKAVENENVENITEYIDPQYRDASGMTYDEIKELILEFLAQVDSIKIQMSGMKLNIDSTGRGNVVFASCSLGLRVLARYEGERVLAFGGIVHPGSVRGFFRKAGHTYRLYYAEY